MSYIYLFYTNLKQTDCITHSVVLFNFMVDKVMEKPLTVKQKSFTNFFNYKQQQHFFILCGLL